MSTLDNPKALFQSSCSTNSEPYALQNIGDMMSPEFSENCILIIDPSMPIHNEAYVIIDFKGELYFRQYFEENGKKLIKSINSLLDEIELNDDFEYRGCVVQQKQRGQKALHYYLPNKLNGEIEFSLNGKEKPKK
jgi:phage repressor protein C with HTH and peptisase S24 domain